MKNIATLITIALAVLALYILFYAFSLPVITEEEEPFEVEIPVVSQPVN
jgi:hypothetical protein|tara:strand:+ start:308 stop:454 length:147 start_codon:yes stop_codon:yes gene_type:complete